MIGLGIGLGLRPSVGGPTPWTPDNLDPSCRTNGGWWDAQDQTSSSGAVTAWPDKWGVRPMAQATGANRPTVGTVAGYTAAVWPDVGNEVSLDVSVAFAPAWWLSVLQYRDGLAATFAGPDCIAGNGLIGTARLLGSSGAATISSASWTDQARKNGSASLSTTVLPLPISMLSFSAAPVSGVWSIGRGSGGSLRGWKGAQFATLALGTVPSDADRQKIEGYFANRFGLTASLPSDHPYKSAPPMVAA